MLGFVLWLGCGLATPNGVAFHDVQASKQLIDSSDVLVLDVRTPGEFAAGHLENAINIDFKSSDFAEQLSKLDTSKPVVVHCQSGGRSRMALSYVEAAGFTTIHHMDGGYGAWASAGLPSTR